jgi:hypothetical protein
MLCCVLKSCFEQQDAVPKVCKRKHSQSAMRPDTTTQGIAVNTIMQGTFCFYSLGMTEPQEQQLSFAVWQ